MKKIKNLGLFLVSTLSLVSYLLNGSSILTSRNDVLVSHEGHSHNSKDNFCASGSALDLAEEHGNHDSFNSALGSSSNPTSLSGTSYYLTGDLTLSTEVIIYNSMTICLNGNNIIASTSNRIFNVYQGYILTICDCKESGEITGGNLSSGDGGAIYLNSNSKLVLDSGIISSNTAVNGGAIYLSSSASFEMNGGTITNNTATAGGGAIYGAGSNTITITGGTISSNTLSAANGYGGGINITGSASSITMNGGTITNNSITGGTAGYGGGIAARTGSKVYLNGGTISNNKASTVDGGTGYGGGIFIGQSGLLEMNSGTITGNLANNVANPNSGTGFGGGVNVNTGGTFIMNDGSISSNYAVGNYYSRTKGYGAAVRVYSASFYMNGGQINSNKIYSDSSTNNALAIVEVTSGVGFQMNGGYLAGEVIFNTSVSSTLSVVHGYLGDVTYDNLSSNIADGSTHLDISNSNYQSTFDDDYISSYKHAIYKEGTTPTYNAYVNGDVCVDTDFTNYITVVGNDLGNSVSYSYDDGIVGLPTTVGEHTITVTVRDYLDSSDNEKVYYKSGTASFDIEIKEHQFTDNLTYDDDYHWFECVNDICDGAFATKEPHNFVWTTNKVSDIEYEFIGECDSNCGKIETIRINIEDGEGTVKTYTYGGTDCRDPEYIETIYEVNDQSYLLSSVYTGNYGPHDYQDIWSYDEEKHWKVCNNGCGINGEETPHTFESNVWDVVEGTYNSGFTLENKCLVCVQDIDITLPAITDENTGEGLTYQVVTNESNCITPTIKYYYYGETLVLTQTTDDYGPHDYEDEWQTTAARHWRVCKNNSSHIGEEGTHVFTEWETQIEATETEDGLETRYCKVCEYLEERDIDMLGEDTTIVVPTPTPSTPEKESNTLMYVIIGVCGGVCLLALIISIILVVIERRKNNIQVNVKKVTKDEYVEK